jgi:hypothetical protein
MPTPTPRLTDLEDVKQWIAAHDARCETLWAHQRAYNVRVENLVTKIGLRVSALELKVMFWAGVAACGGGIIGTFITKLIGV